MLLLLFVAACRGERTPPGTLVVALESWPGNLDPRHSTDAASSRIGKLVFRSLTVTDRSQRHVPDLAVEWRLESDREAVFRLREDAAFHDGSPLTSADVRATYESILDPATASPKRETLAFLESIETPDPKTVRLRMKEPFAPFLEASAIGILPAAVARGGGLVGSGPFRIAAAEAGHEVRLESVAEESGLSAIRFRIIPDDTIRALEAQKGSIHFVQNAIEPDNLRWLAAHSDRCLVRTPGSTFHYLGINARDRRLRDLRVRRAIAAAIDRDSLVEHLLNGYARPASGLLSPTHWAYEGEVERHDHDPALARRLLDQAGFADPDGDGPAARFRLSYKTTIVDSRRRLAEAIQANLAEAGIAIDVRSFEWGTFYDDVRRGNFELYSLAWVGVTDPDIYYAVLHSAMVPPRGNNRGGYANLEIDRLTVLGRATHDLDERRRIYARVQKLAAIDLPFIPLWWSDNVAVFDPRLCGFVPYPDGELASLGAARWSEQPPCGCDSGP